MQICLSIGNSRYRLTFYSSKKGLKQNSQVQRHRTSKVTKFQLRLPENVEITKACTKFAGLLYISHHICIAWELCTVPQPFEIYGTHAIPARNTNVYTTLTVL